MNSKIYDLWEEFIEYGYNIRLKNKDGYIGWTTVKDVIPDVKLNWTDKPKTFYDKLVELGVNNKESPEEAGLPKEKWERHHYILQHGNIVKKNPEGSLVKLLQIAYNAGQFKRELEKEIYPAEQMKFYIENELNKVTIYIDKNIPISTEDVAKIKEKFATNLSGGRRIVKTNYEQYFDYYINQLKFK